MKIKTNLIAESDATVQSDFTLEGDQSLLIQNVKAQYNLPATGTKCKVVTVSDYSYSRLVLTSTENSRVQAVEIFISKQSSTDKPVLRRSDTKEYHIHSNDLIFSSDSSGNVWLEKTLATTRFINIYTLETYKGTATIEDGQGTTTGGATDECEYINEVPTLQEVTDAGNTTTQDIWMNRVVLTGNEIHFDGGGTGEVLTFRTDIVTNNNEVMKLEPTNNGANLTVTDQLILSSYQTADADGTPVKTLGVDGSGNVVKFDASTGTVDGTGTVNYVPKWTDADTLSSTSKIFDNGTDVIFGSNADNDGLVTIVHETTVAAAPNRNLLTVKSDESPYYLKVSANGRTHFRGNSTTGDGWTKIHFQHTGVANAHSIMVWDSSGGSNQMSLGQHFENDDLKITRGTSGTNLAVFARTTDDVTFNAKTTINGQGSDILDIYNDDTSPLNVLKLKDSGVLSLRNNVFDSTIDIHNGDPIVTGYSVVIGHDAITGADFVPTGGFLAVNSWNTIVGSQAAKNIVANAGGYITAFGAAAGEEARGNYCVYVGNGAGRQMAHGDVDRNSNVALGVGAMYLGLNEQGIAIGHEAGRNAYGLRNIHIGHEAGENMGTSVSNEDDNVVIGYQAGKDSNNSESVFVGAYAGFESLASNRDNRNTYVGRRAGYGTSGGWNTYLGDETGETVIGDNNTILGANAAFNANVTDLGVWHGNTVIGYNAAGVANIGGWTQMTDQDMSNNIIIGHGTAAASTMSNGNTIIGSNILIGDTNDLSDTVVIGSNNNERFRITSDNKFGVGTTSPSEAFELYGDEDRFLVHKLHQTTVNQTWYEVESDDGKVLRMGLGDSDQTFAFILTDKDVLSFYLNGAPQMEIFNTGVLQLKKYTSTDADGTAVKTLGVDASGNVVKFDGASGSLDGTGTANYLPKWDDADTLGNSSVYDNNGKIGINNTSASALLEIHSPTVNQGTELFVVKSDESPYYMKVGDQGATWFKGNSTTGIGAVGLFLQHSGNTDPNAYALLVYESSGGVSQWAIGQYTADDDLRIRNISTGKDTLQFYRTSGDLDINAKTRINGQGSDILTLWNNESTPVNVFKVMHTGDIELGRDGQQILVSTFAGADADGDNIWIGGGGLSSVGDVNDGRVGSSNIAIGVDAMLNTTTGKDNVAIGLRALGTSTEGVQNVAIGYESLYDLTTGNWNTATGYKASSNNTTGSYNTSLGFAAGFGSTTADANTSIGYAALYAMTSGEQNTALGKGAGWGTSTEGNNLDCNNSVFVGHHAVPKLTGETNQIVIGHNTTGNGSNTVTLGNDNVTGTYLQGTINLNDYQTADSDGTPVKTLGVDASGNVVKFDGASGSLDGTGATDRVAFWSDADTLTQADWLNVDTTAETLAIGTGDTAGELTTRIGKSDIQIYTDDDIVYEVFKITGTISNSDLEVRMGDINNEFGESSIHILPADGKIVNKGKVCMNSALYVGGDTPDDATSSSQIIRSTVSISGINTSHILNVTAISHGYDSMMHDYVLSDGSGNMRTGTVTVLYDGTSAYVTDIQKGEAGDTSDVVFGTSILSTTLFLTCETTVAVNWSFKFLSKKI